MIQNVPRWHHNNRIECNISLLLRNIINVITIQVLWLWFSPATPSGLVHPPGSPTGFPTGWAHGPWRSDDDFVRSHCLWHLLWNDQTGPTMLISMVFPIYFFRFHCGFINQMLPLWTISRNKKKGVLHRDASAGAPPAAHSAEMTWSFQVRFTQGMGLGVAGIVIFIVMDWIIPSFPTIWSTSKNSHTHPYPQFYCHLNGTYPQFYCHLTGTYP